MASAVFFTGEAPLLRALAGTVLALLFVLAPVLAVWPGVLAGILPSRWRPSLVRRRRPVVLATATLLGLVAGWAVVELALTAPRRAGNAPIVGLAAFCALAVGALVRRAGGIVLRRWEAALPLWSSLTVSPPVIDAGTVDVALPGARADKPLRRVLRWCAALAFLWYWLGRAVQGHSLWRYGDSGHMGAWWITIGVVLVATAVAAWLARQAVAIQRSRAARRAGLPTSLAGLVQSQGWAVFRPVPQRLRDLLRCAPPLQPGGKANAVTWLMALRGLVDEQEVWVVDQESQGSRRGVPGVVRRRTMWLVRLPGSVLPFVWISCRADVMPELLRFGKVFEFEDFNRSMWVWGPDARGVHGLVHPRVMEMLASSLPDGSSVVMRGDVVAVVRPGAFEPAGVLRHARFAAQLARLVPSYMTGTAHSREAGIASPGVLPVRRAGRLAAALLLCAALLITGAAVSHGVGSGPCAETAPGSASPAARAYVNAVNAADADWAHVGNVLRANSGRVVVEAAQLQVTADSQFLADLKRVRFPVDARPAARRFEAILVDYIRNLSRFQSPSVLERAHAFRAMERDDALRSDASHALRHQLGLESSQCSVMRP